MTAQYFLYRLCPLSAHHKKRTLLASVLFFVVMRSAHEPGACDMHAHGFASAPQSDVRLRDGGKARGYSSMMKFPYLVFLLW